MGAPVQQDDNGQLYDADGNPVDENGNVLADGNGGAAPSDGGMGALIQQILMGGYGQQSLPLSNVTVPLNQGVSKAASGYTFPLANVTKLQSQEKGAAGLMGYNPIQGYGGPDFKPYVSQSDAIAQEAKGDPVAEGLLNSINQGEGSLSLKKQLQAATYDDKNDNPDPKSGKVIPASQAKNYLDWIDRMVKAKAVDMAEQTKREQQSTLGDPESDVPTQEAQNFDPTAWVGQRAAAGDYGSNGSTLFQGLQRANQADQNKSDLAPWAGGAGNGVTRGFNGGGLVKDWGSEGSSQRTQAMFQEGNNMAQVARMRSAQNVAQKALPQAVEGSPAKQQAIRLIQAYRLMMGMNPNG